MRTLGDRIKYIRKENNLNQVEFSKIIGVSQGTLSEIEQNKYKPSIDAVILIYTNFKVDLEWLLIDSVYYNNLNDTYKLEVNGKEKELLTLFNKLHSDDQNEVKEIISLKLKKY
ncbi:MAG: helix-turn-helix transcriptional regulator [Bacillota bacterium]|nr:helix-turn-helix transcriptional regulator [Bacillota bacterium]MDP4155618.1 helix-turn-helix transcriptional regulator [Bacillota bacterium]